MPKAGIKPPVDLAKSPEQPTESSEDCVQVEQMSSILVPIAIPDSGYCPKAVTTGLSRRQGAALKPLMCGLIRDNAKCEMEGFSERGKAVEAYGHVVRWILDRVADEWEKKHKMELSKLEELVF